MYRFVLLITLLTLNNDIARLTVDASKSASTYQSNLIRSTNANALDAPYHVSVRSKTNHHLCSGAIISSSWIITAAHCTCIETINTICVVVGTINLNSGGFKYTLKSIKNHPEYDIFTQKNDISLLQIESRFIYSAIINKVPIESSYYSGGVTATITGWSLIRSSSKTNILQKRQVKTFENNECIAKQQNVFNKRRIFNTSLCADTQNKPGFYYGDSGGPLVSNHLIGIFSFGSILNGDVSPDVYTRVSSYVDWINKIIS